MPSAESGQKRIWRGIRLYKHMPKNIYNILIEAYHRNGTFLNIWSTYENVISIYVNILISFQNGMQENISVYP